jgi:hypothetical protein
MSDRSARAAAGWGQVDPQDEEFHGIAPSHGYRATETFYTGFSIPEAALNCEVYFWGHPALGTASAGVYVWQGDKPASLHAEYASYQNFLPFPQEPLSRLTLPIGLTHEIQEPLSRQRIAFADPEVDTVFDVTLTGICPPVVRPGGHHLVQPMKTRGTLRLRGRDYTVDGFFTRDRSWLEERSEARNMLPPVTWCVGVFDDRTAFHAVGFDDPEASEQIRRLFPDFPARARLRWGFLLENGKLCKVADWSKRTRRAADRVTPTGFDLALSLEDGRRVEVAGTVRARLPISIWPNMVTHFCQTEWLMNGVSGFGDAQDIQFNEFIHRALNDRA